MSRHKNLSDTKSSSASENSAQTLNFDRLSLDDQSHENKKVAPDSWKVFSAGIFDKETVIQSKIWGNRSDLIIKAKTYDDGSTAIQLQATVPTLHNPIAKAFVEFKDDDKTAQVRYYNARGVVPGALSAAVPRRKELEKQYLKIWIDYKRAQLGGTPLESCIAELGESANMLQVVVKQLATKSKKRRDPGILLNVDWCPHLAKFLDNLPDIKSINPMQQVNRNWWQNAYHFNRVQRAAVKKEYDMSVEDDKKFMRGNLIAEFKERDVDELLGTKSATAFEQMKEVKGRKGVYQVILKTGPKYEHSIKQMKMEEGDKLILEWHVDDKASTHKALKGVVCESDISAAGNSPNIIAAMTIILRTRDVPGANDNLRFSVRPETSKATMDRMNKSLASIASAHPDTPCYEIYQCILQGKTQKEFKLQPTVSDTYKKFLKSSVLDKFQIQGVTSALDLTLQLISTSVGTGKSKIITHIIAALILGSACSGNRTKILVTAPTNSAVSHLAQKWYRFCEGKPENIFRDTGVVRILADKFYKELDGEYDSDVDDNADEELLNTFLDLDKLNSLKLDFQQKYALMEQRKQDKRWNEYSELFTALLTGKLGEEVVKRFREVRENMDRDIFSRTTIVFATCLGSRSPLIEENFKPDFVIVGDVNHASEAEAIVPISYHSVKQVTLVGDLMGLPPVNMHGIPILQCGILTAIFGRQKPKPLTPGSDFWI
ncbi:hypothetical protein AA313_de0206943 [Arthrobotrys entomopaga]|nr:hypothetical protein AA313_de0206943 [Arthrobotrys entomopaga]